MVTLSPNGEHISYKRGFGLIIYSVKNEEEIIINLKDDLDEHKWSPDSLLIAGCFRGNNMIKVWCLDDLTWDCTIYEPMCGFNWILWSPDSRHILVVMKKLSRVTIWSLVDKSSVLYVKDLKTCHLIDADFDRPTDTEGDAIIAAKTPKKYYPGSAEVISFSPDGSYLAVLENGGFLEDSTRVVCNKISLFFLTYPEDNDSDGTVDWKLDKFIELPSDRIEGFSWSPNSCIICSWERFNYGVIHVYEIQEGKCLAKIELKNLGDRLIPSPQTLLTCTWTFGTPLFFTLWFYPDRVILYNSITWEPFYALIHPDKITEDDVALVHEETLVRQPLNSSSLRVEPESKSQLPLDDSSENSMVALDNSQNEVPCHDDSTVDTRWESKYLIKRERPYDLKSLPIQDPTVSSLSYVHCDPHNTFRPKFSPDNRFLTTFRSRTPNCIYVWSMTSGVLVHVLTHKLPVTDYEWHPYRNLLAICTGSQCCFLWTPASCATYREQATIIDDEHVNRNHSHRTNSRILDINIRCLIWSMTGTELVVTGANEDITKPYRIIHFTKELIEELCSEAS